MLVARPDNDETAHNIDLVSCPACTEDLGHACVMCGLNNTHFVCKISFRSFQVFWF